jgi:hypothetical protein
VMGMLVMIGEETLKSWRIKLNCENAVKRQLAEEYANADTKEEIKLLDEIWELIYKRKISYGKNIS